MAESAHRRAQPGSDAGDDATTSEPSVVFVIGRARITSAARIAQTTDTVSYHVACQPLFRTVRADPPPTNQVSDPPSAPCAGVDPPNQPTFWGWLPSVPAASFRVPPQRPARVTASLVACLVSAAHFLDVNELLAISLALNRVRLTTAGLLIDQPPRDPPMRPK